MWTTGWAVDNFALGTVEGASAVADDAPANIRLRYADIDDAEVTRHTERLWPAANIGVGDRVLDIGCGTGQTACAAAKIAKRGRVLGVDIDAGMVRRASERAVADGLGNVEFVRADAQVHEFPAAFDVCISRFGVMFFADPVAAFANIARALRPGARFAALVWQPAERNEWDVAIREALAVDAEPSGPSAFSLADPVAVQRILGAAGFTEVNCADVREPVFYGSDVDSAVGFVTGFVSTRTRLATLSAVDSERALDRLRATIDEHRGATGVWFDSSAWLITASR
ncbi:MAG: methyltransferase domain-containing protein [Sciscionella sp.]|nr:methyltransferase domain-containing protein [Sciscionella sp.]